MKDLFLEEWGPDLKYTWLLNMLRFHFGQFATEIRLPLLGPKLTRGGITATNGQCSYSLPQCYTLLVTAKTCRDGNCFCIQRAFRANDCASRFHLQEFDLLECGMANTSSEQAMVAVESILRDLYEKTHRGSCCGFPRMTWEQMKVSSRTFKHFDEESPGQIELQDFSHGQKLTEPVFVTNLPWSQSSWATKTVSSGVTTRFNLLVPEVGEIAEGGERLLARDSMSRLFDKIGLSSQLGWYAESLSSDVAPVSVFAIGIERLAMWLFGYDDIQNCHTWTTHPGT